MPTNRRKWELSNPLSGRRARSRLSRAEEGSGPALGLRSSWSKLGGHGGSCTRSWVQEAHVCGPEGGSWGRLVLSCNLEQETAQAMQGEGE